MKLRFPKSAAAALVLTLALLGAIPLAQAERAKKGNIVIAFHGDIGPVKLPRQRLAPVTVRMGGKILTTDRTAPPRLNRIILDVNRHGKLRSTGLPKCPLRRLKAVDSNTAKRICRNAQIGRGNVTSRIGLPGQGEFATNGPLLAFNGRHKGRQAIFAHVTTRGTLPLTYVIVFEVRKTRGTFGNSLIGTLPPIASSYGYISAFEMALSRRYRYRGKKMSYASANCPAPGGFTAAPFPFLRSTFEFDDGRKISAKLIRQCKVRGK
jgi:hypothetical protein